MSSSLSLSSFVFNSMSMNQTLSSCARGPDRRADYFTTTSLPCISAA